MSLTYTVRLANVAQAAAGPLNARQRVAPAPAAGAVLAQAIVPSSPFDPSQATHTWRVAAFVYSEFTIVLPALARLRAEAPNTRLAIMQCTPAQVAKKAEQGEIDLAFLAATEAPPELRRRPLFTERYVLAGRIGHPHLKRRPTLAQFCKLEHVMASPEGGGFQGVTDTALSELGVARQVVLSLPHFLVLTAVLERTDLVALGPSRLVQGNASLRFAEPPLGVPGFEMVMLWPERVHRDPSHQWLRKHIAT